MRQASVVPARRPRGRLALARVLGRLIGLARWALVAPGRRDAGGRPAPKHPILLLALALVLAPGAAAARFVDAVVAEVDGAPITASDVALARALSLFGLTPSAAPIERTTVVRYVDAHLVARAASELGLEGTPEEREGAWRAVAARVGAASPEAWLAARGVAPAWARGLVEADARRRRFLEQRFRAFAFVTAAEVEAALGPGAHDAAAREATVERLRAAAVARRVAEWLADARARAAIRVLLAPGETVPDPLAGPDR
jgi:hypothetical protein